MRMRAQHSTGQTKRVHDSHGQAGRDAAQARRRAARVHVGISLAVAIVLAGHVPAAQLLHVYELVAPVVAEYLPAGRPAHAVSAHCRFQVVLQLGSSHMPHAWQSVCFTTARGRGSAEHHPSVVRTGISMQDKSRFLPAHTEYLHAKRPAPP